MSSVASVVPNDREQTILSQLHQVELLAKQIHRRCPPEVELADLISAGTVGLIKAVDRFDPTRQCKLCTIAEYRIRGAIVDYLRQVDPLPRHVRQFQKRREAASAKMEDQLGRIPSADQVAGELGVSTETYTKLSVIIHASMPISLDTLAGAPGIAATHRHEPEQTEISPEMKNRLREAVSNLPSELRTVVEGILAGKAIREIATELQVAPGHVSYLRARAIAKLRSVLLPRESARKARGATA